VLVDLIVDRFSRLNILDLGANIGFTSAFLKQHLPNANILAVEPDESNYEVLIHNFHGDSLKGAVWSHDCEVEICRDFRDGKEWSYYVREARGTGLKAYSIQTLMSDFDMPYVDILKMDIEGGEKEVFTNPDFLKNVGIIAIEIHDEFQCRDLINNCLWEYGFTTEEHGELTVGFKK
jgi:FkbM family methyltransferase